MRYDLKAKQRQLEFDPVLNRQPMKKMFSEVPVKMVTMRSETEAHNIIMRSTPKVAFETVPVFVVFTMALSRPFTEGNIV